jgi:putative endopeptidase
MSGLRRFRNYCGLIKVVRSGFPWEKTTKSSFPSIYINCETAVVPHLCFVGMLLLAIPASAQKQTTPAKTMHALDPKLMDTSVEPCVNFYQYACGGWLKQNPIPQDESSYGRFSQLMDENQLVLKTILEKAAAGGSGRSPNEQKIGDYYASCMNVDAVNQAGLKPLQPLLDRIAALASRDELPELTAYLDGIGVNSLFSFGSQQDYKDATQQIAMVDQTDLGLPEKGYYERKDDKSVELRNQYVAHVARIFALLGETQQQAAKDAETVLKLETALAGYSLSNVERRDPASLYHMMNLLKFDSSTPAFHFAQFLRAVQAPPVQSLNVTVPAYFVGLNQLLENTSLDEWKTYLRWALIHHLPSTALPQALDKELFDFYGKVLDGQPEQKTRWKRCVSETDDALGEALGQVYVEQRFSPQDKQRTLKLTQDVEAAMGRDIEQLDWMSAATKARLLHPDCYPRRCVGQRAACGCVPRKARHCQDRQAGGSRRMGYESAHGQCRLQPADERHQLSGRHPAASIF